MYFSLSCLASLVPGVILTATWSVFCPDPGPTGPSVAGYLTAGTMRSTMPDVPPPLDADAHHEWGWLRRGTVPCASTWPDAPCCGRHRPPPCTSGRSAAVTMDRDPPDAPPPPLPLHQFWTPSPTSLPARLLRCCCDHGPHSTWCPPPAVDSVTAAVPVRLFLLEPWTVFCLLGGATPPFHTNAYCQSGTGLLWQLLLASWSSLCEGRWCIGAVCVCGSNSVVVPAICCYMGCSWKKIGAVSW